MGKDSFKDDIQQWRKEIIEENKKRIRIAYERIKKEVEKEIQIIINRDMIDNYYNGYEPLIYQRTKQLGLSVAPMVIDKSIGDDLVFSVAIGKDPSRMNHSTLTMKVVRKLKSGKISEHTYQYNDDVEEEDIYNNFKYGIHLNANPIGVTETPTTPTLAEATKALDKLLEDGGRIDQIINEVFNS